MEYHSVYGVSVPEYGWVPAPGYLLRRDRILRMFRGFPQGSYLEVGCGAGALLHELSQMGFSCTALETSDAAFELASFINRDNQKVEFCKQPREEWSSAFDYVAAFEVLEHIEDDRLAIEQWAGWLKPGGRLLLSVPAHQKRWNASDVWAGHCRRYEKDQLKDLVEQTGFSIEKIECYGFPLRNIIEPLRARHHAKQLSQETSLGNSEEQRVAHNDRSGIARSLESRLYPLQASWLGTKLMKANFFLQGLFVGTNWGSGYLVLARLK